MFNRLRFGSFELWYNNLQFPRYNFVQGIIKFTTTYFRWQNPVAVLVVIAELKSKAP